MTDQGEDTWGAMIPSGSVTLRGVEYYIEAVAAGRTAYSPAVDPATQPYRVPVQVTDSDGDGALATLTRTYRMISFPADLDDGTVPALLEDDLGTPDSTAGAAARGRRERAVPRSGPRRNDALLTRPRAWLITDRARSIDFTGQTVFLAGDDGYAITLQPGWNQISDPFAYDVALEDVQVNDGTVIRSFAQAVAAGLLEAQPLHAYDGTAYQSAGRCPSPWTGYFVANLTENAVDLVVPRMRRW